MRMTRTDYLCWKCQHALWHLDQPLHGWSYHCQHCQHLTSPRLELEAAMAAKPAGSLGIVTAVPCEIEIQPAT